MRIRKSTTRLLLLQCLQFALVINCLISFTGSFSHVQAQRRVIVVNADQPNLWTLEQAHYLLAQMHRRNLDLKAKSLEELDPNEIAGLRFDVMRMLVEFGATFNQADLATNRLLTANQTFNSDRRQKLLDDRTRLSNESVKLSGDIKDLEIQKADTEDADQKKKLDAKITAMTTNQAKIDKQIESIDAELKTLNAPSGTPTATTGGATFDASKLPSSVFDEAFKQAAAKQIAKFNDEPRLNASLRLDNFLQMQYEIISKQLALLRDELGPGERLVFLELPQTINATHHEADQKWAQSWWKIAGYTWRKRTDEINLPTLPPAVEENQRPITITQDMGSILTGTYIPLPLKQQAVPCNPAAPFVYRENKAIRITDRPSMTLPAQPKPLSFNVSAPGKVTKVTVTLNGLSHPHPNELDILLVGPQGQNALLMSSVGGATPVNDLTITLDDNPGLSRLTVPLSSGTYQPTNASAGTVNFPSADATPLGGSALSVFNGTNPNGTWKLYIVDHKDPVEGSLSNGWTLNITTDCSVPAAPPPKVGVNYEDVFENLEHAPTTTLDGYLTRTDSNPAPPRLENRMVRTVELIPRQSSLNVNDMKLQTRAGAFNFVLSTLFGFGSRLNIERQREQFSQFVQQELYSSAFGKGAREFGWTFTPMPGTDRLQSGVRTTYAVVVVPEEATSIVLESNGCYFPRAYYPPNDFNDTKTAPWNDVNRTSRNCGGMISKAFVVPIPSARPEGGNEFWVDKIAFQAVAKGKRIVVEIRGKNFSPQTGVLVDGIPLVESIGLAQPLIRDDSAAGRATVADLKDAEVQGQFERVNSEKVVFSFKMASDYKGTPTITLIAPGRATDLNDLPLQINDDHDKKLKDYLPKMIGNERKPDDFRIDGIRVTGNRATGHLTAQVSGAGFVNTDRTPLQADHSDTVAQVLVNGSAVTATFRSPTLLTIVFPAPKDDTIKVTLVSSNAEPKKVETVESDAVPNPAFLSISDVEVTTYDAEAEGEPATLLVKIKGTGFTDSLRALLEGKILPVAVKSATEAVFTMPDPKAAAIVALEDDSGQRAKIVVTRKVKPQKD